MRREITTGMKVKVHHKNIALYGELMGTNHEGKLLLANRPDFYTLKLSEFDLFRAYNQVEFLKPELRKPQYHFFMIPDPKEKPVQKEKPKLKPSAKRVRILNNLRQMHEVVKITH